jgi:hypothetical protein
MNKTRFVCAMSVVLTLVGGAFCQTTLPTSRPTTLPTDLKPGKRLSGRIVKIEGADLVIRGLRMGDDGKLVAEDLLIATNDSTRFTMDIDRATFDDLKVGMLVVCASVPAHHDHPGFLLVSATSPGVSGIIMKVDANDLVLKLNRPANGETEITVPTDENTRVFYQQDLPHQHGFVEGKADGLETGMQVNVIPPTGTARKIFVPADRYGPDATQAGRL